MVMINKYRTIYSSGGARPIETVAGRIRVGGAIVCEDNLLFLIYN